MNPKEILLKIFGNEEKKESFIHSKLNELKQTYEGDDLLLLVIKHIFFYGDETLKYQSLIEESQNNEWLKKFIGSVIMTFITSKDNILTYGMTIKYFCDCYDNIKKEFNEFIKEIEKIKSKINFDLFEVAVCFMCYLNKNYKMLNIISELEKSDLIKVLKEDNDITTKDSVYYTLTEYCILYKMPIIQDKKYEKNNIKKEKIIEEIRDLNCFAELCPIKKAYKNFLLTLCSCLKDATDLRLNQKKSVADFIEIIFIILRIHLKDAYYWEEQYLSIMINEIYSESFKYCTDNFNENYFDFVISYITHYQITSADFLNMFLKGLNKDDFNNIFQYLKLNEYIGDINEKETIARLLDKMYKRKKNSYKSQTKGIKGNNSEQKSFSESRLINTSIEFNKEKKNKVSSCGIIIDNNGKTTKENKEKNENDSNDMKKDNIENEKTETVETINKEKNIHIISETNNESDKKISQEKIILKDNNENIFEQKKKNEDKKEPEKTQENFVSDDINDKFLNFRKEMDNKFQSFKKENEMELLNLKEENKLMKEDIDFLQNENIKKEIEIKKLKENLKFINLDLERISFRDLSKIVLNNMIDLVNEKNGKLLQGLSKRKEKLDKINKNFDFKNIEYMRKPLKEISDKYYHSNSRGYIPDIVKDLKQKPFGLKIDQAGIILKKYYEIMVDSKQDKVFEFLSNIKNIKQEINKLYL